MPDPILTKNLKQAATQPRNFVLAVKGTKIALFLSKKPINDSMKLEVKGRVGAAGTYIGVCQKDTDGLTFKSEEALPGIGPKLKKFIKEETGLTVSPNLVQVTDLVQIDEDGPDFSDVQGAEPAIDIDARRKAELKSLILKMQAFRASFNDKLQEYQDAYKIVAAKRSAAGKATRNAKAELKAEKAETAPDATRISDLENAIATLAQEEDSLYDGWNEARENVSKVKQLNVNYEAVLKAVAAEKDFDKRYEMLQPGRIGAIDAVKQKMEEVFTRTNRSLAILGRTKHTFEGDESWAAKHDDEKGRVLAEDDWSMAVNDAFIKAGLDQKADFAMITKFKDNVLAKIKSLTQDPGGKSLDDRKKELRDFVKQEQDGALFTGGSHNDGFAISMVELEQLLDDGYVMMQHDPDAQGKKLKDLKPEQVMVPSGKGQQIKEELGKAVEDREERLKVKKKQINDDFAELLRSSKLVIKDSPKAIKVVRLIKTAMDENRWEDADKALKALQQALN